MLTVNGSPAVAGCVVEGHWGQYGPDHLADQLDGWALTIARTDDPRWWRKVADRFETIAGERGEYAGEGITTWGAAAHRAASAWEAHSETAYALIERANAVTTGGYWEWWEGEVFLRSYVCGQCGRDARRPLAVLTDGPRLPLVASECDYCCDADDPGIFADGADVTP